MTLNFAAPAQTDAAVVLASDAAFLPYALHLIWQIILHSPGRDFDVVLVSDAPLTLPDWADAAGVHFVASNAVQDAPQMTSTTLSLATYLRLFLPQLLKHRYQRLLYVDSDMFFEGGDLGRLLRLDLGGHALAATTDVLQLLDPTYHAQEYKAMGLGPHRYFNAGFLLIDVPAWEAADLTTRCLRFPIDHPAACVLHDQSILNGLLRGKFAELSPVWNWMLNIRLPPLSQKFAPRFRHFASQPKPWNDMKGVHEARFRLSYAEFFRHSGILPGTAKPVPVDADPLVMSWKTLLRQAADLAYIGPRIDSALGRFQDEWEVKR